MGRNLFGADIAGTINSVLGPLLGEAAEGIYYDRAPALGVDPARPSAGTRLGALVPYPCTAIKETKARLVPNSRLVTGDIVITVLGDSCEVPPKVNGEIELNGERYVINEVNSDPDLAAYELICRGLASTT